MRIRIAAVAAAAFVTTTLLLGVQSLRPVGVDHGGARAHPGVRGAALAPAAGGTAPSARAASAARPTTAGREVPGPLAPGARPPQFVVVSFDGVGWHDMWRHWFSVARRVPFHFTGFLSGTYLLSDRTRTAYDPPHYPPGTSEIGWRPPADLPQEIRDLNRALADGDEIGTHFNGHFCASAGLPSGGNTWDTDDWDAELDQFFALLSHVRRNNGLAGGPALRVGAGDIRGERTPCLEGTPRALFPALRHHGLAYDASFSRAGLAWPTRSAGGIWQLGMGVFPMHGTLPDGRTGVPVTAMDYNYFFVQRQAGDAGLSVADSARDRDQVLATYRDMYAAAYRGNRAPLILGNHFNDWNHGAYREALTRFVLETCGRPETRCVTFSELVDWLDAQPHRVLARLQALPAETGPPPRRAAGGSVVTPP